MLWGSIRSTVKKISETKSEILRKLRRTTETFQKPEIGTLTLGLLFRFLMSNSQLQTSFLEGLCPSSLLWTCSKVWRSFLNTDCSGNPPLHYNFLQALTVTTTTGRAMGSPKWETGMLLKQEPLSMASMGPPACRTQCKQSPPWTWTWQPMDGADSGTREEMEKAQGRQWMPNMDVLSLEAWC